MAATVGFLVIVVDVVVVVLVDVVVVVLGSAVVVVDFTFLAAFALMTGESSFSESTFSVVVLDVSSSTGKWISMVIRWNSSANTEVLSFTLFHWPEILSRFDRSAEN